MIVTGMNGDVPISASARPANPYRQFQALATDTFTHRTVTPEGALALPAVYGAVSLISNLIGTMPLEVLDTRGGLGVRVDNASVARMLRFQPNEDMGASQLWSLVVAHILLRGNAYLAKVRGANGYVSELYPLPADSVFPFRDEFGRKRFAVRLYDGATQVNYVYDKQSILHIAGPSLGDGLQGASPIALLRNTLGVHLSQKEWQARFYRDGAKPGGVLSTPEMNVSKDTVDLIKTQWRTAQAGVTNAHEIAVLHSGMQYQNITVSPEDQQLLESLKYGTTEVATMFNLPASRLNAQGASMEYKTAVQDDLVMHKQAIRPRAHFIEEALNIDTDLFGAASPWVPRFNFDEWLRADIETRFRVYQMSAALGMDSANTLLAAEGRPPRIDDGGDEFKSIKQAPATAPVGGNSGQQ